MADGDEEPSYVKVAGGTGDGIAQDDALDVLDLDRSAARRQAGTASCVPGTAGSVGWTGAATS